MIRFPNAKINLGLRIVARRPDGYHNIDDKYLKIGWKARQAAFAESHKDELDSFNKAFLYLKKQGVDLNVNLDSLQADVYKRQTKLSS